MYGARPLVCRMLGHVEFMPCPYGYVPATINDGPEIMQRYSELELRTFAQWARVAPSLKMARALRDREESP